jgi:hypothetical protein
MQQVRFLIHDVPGSSHSPRRVYRPGCTQGYIGARSVPGLERDKSVKSTLNPHHNLEAKSVMRVVTKKHYQFASFDTHDALAALIGNLNLPGAVRFLLAQVRNRLETTLIADGVL